MAELVEQMLRQKGAYWTPAAPYPDILDDGRQFHDQAAAERVAAFSQIAFGYPTTIESLRQGEEFPLLALEHPLLGVTIDTRIVGTSSLIAKSIKGAAGHMHETAEAFEAAAATIEQQFGYFGRAALYQTVVGGDQALLARHRCYVEASSAVDDQYVGLRSDQMQPFVPFSEEHRFDEAGAFTPGEPQSANWRGNIVLPRLEVGGRYMELYDGNRGVEHFRVRSAQLLWLPEGYTALPTVPHPRFAREVPRIPRQRPGPTRPNGRTGQVD